MSQSKKEIRDRFRQQCYRRDKYRCVCCLTQMVGLFDVHHITDRHNLPIGGYVMENGITLCETCHLHAEQFHISNGERWVPGFHPDELYRKIGSSYEKALTACQKLIQ